MLTKSHSGTTNSARVYFSTLFSGDNGNFFLFSINSVVNEIFWKTVNYVHKQNINTYGLVITQILQFYLK